MEKKKTVNSSMRKLNNGVEAMTAHGKPGERLHAYFAARREMKAMEALMMSGEVDLETAVNVSLFSAAGLNFRKFEKAVGAAA